MRVKFMMLFKVKFLPLFLVLAAFGICLFLAACGSGATNPPAATVLTVINTPTPGPTSLPTPTYDVYSQQDKSILPTAHIKDAQQEWIRLLDENQKKWATKNVQAYDLTVSFQANYWDPIQVYSYTVKAGKIANQSYNAKDCYCGMPKPKPIPTYKDGSGLTVEGLFEVVRNRVTKSSWSIDTYFRVDFDPEFGYPKSILSDSVSTTDIEIVWNVTSFKVNP